MYASYETHSWLAAILAISSRSRSSALTIRAPRNCDGAMHESEEYARSIPGRGIGFRKSSSPARGALLSRPCSLCTGGFSGVGRADEGADDVDPEDFADSAGTCELLLSSADEEYPEPPAELAGSSVVSTAKGGRM